jgi:hypothetical protein
MFAALLALPVASALIAAVAAGPGPPLFLRRTDSFGCKRLALTGAGHGWGDQFPMVAALERAWPAIQVRHPELPDVAIVLGAGSGKHQASRWLLCRHALARPAPRPRTRRTETRRTGTSIW